MRFTAVLILIGFSITSFAHHARVTFSDEVVELEGELVEVSWRNPHPAFRLRARNSAGGEEDWLLEGAGSLYPLQRKGVTREHFATGQRIRVLGRLSTINDRELLVSNVLLESGIEASLTAFDAEPYWTTTEDAVGFRGYGEGTVDVINAAAENKGIFRIWSPVSNTESYTPFTQEAIAARSSWNPLDNYSIRCETPGLPNGLKGGPHPYEFIDRGEEIIFRGEIYDFVRTIHLNGDPEGQPASPRGYSVGRWEGSTLIVQTTRINWPWFDSLGTPQSEDVEIVERFTLSEDQASLRYHVTITDPLTFTEPATYDRTLFALGEETLPTYNCQAN